MWPSVDKSTRMKTIRLNHSLLVLAVCAAQTVSASNLVVTSPADDGSPGTLRATLAAAADGDTIDLTGITGTIALDGEQLEVDSSVTLLGPGPGQLIIDAQQASRVFYIAPATTVTISGLTIANGYDSVFSDAAGGGILNELASLTLTNCVLLDNSAELGAGIFNDAGLLLFGQPGAATLTLIDCTLDGNISENGAGGAILNASLYTAPASLVVQRCTLSGNSAAHGGGIFNMGNATAQIVNSTLSGNLATSQAGGGIDNSQGGVVRLDGCTLSGNNAVNGQGGGIAVQQATLQIRNTLLSAGTAGANLWVDPAVASTIQSFGYNLSSDDGSGWLAATGDRVNTDPLLGPLQDNGGPTATHALLPGSPAIDTGAATDIAGSPIATDQRGLARPQGIAVDVGAFEVEQAPAQQHQYSWSGVLQPLNSDGSSVVKAGSTVPVKFMLTGEDAGITDLTATLSFANVSGSGVGDLNAANTKVYGGGSQFRFDPASGQYLFNWSTKGLAAGSYRLFIDLGDGVERSVDVTLR